MSDDREKWAKRASGFKKLAEYGFLLLLLYFLLMGIDLVSRNGCPALRWPYITAGILGGIIFLGGWLANAISSKLQVRALISSREHVSDAEFIERFFDKEGMKEVRF